MLDVRCEKIEDKSEKVEVRKEKQFKEQEKVVNTKKDIDAENKKKEVNKIVNSGENLSYWSSVLDKIKSSGKVMIYTDYDMDELEKMLVEN